MVVVVAWHDIAVILLSKQFQEIFLYPTNTQRQFAYLFFFLPYYPPPTTATFLADMTDSLPFLFLQKKSSFFYFHFFISFTGYYVILYDAWCFLSNLFLYRITFKVGFSYIPFHFSPFSSSLTYVFRIFLSSSCWTKTRTKNKNK